MINRRARGNRGHVERSTMGVCRSKLWLVVLSLFAIWSVLICLNYSSLIDSVASLARFYVYSLNYEHPIHIISHPNNNSITGNGSDLHNDQDNVSISEKTEEETGEKAEDTGEKAGDIEDEEIDKLLDVNIIDFEEKGDLGHEQPFKVEDKHDHAQPIKVEDKHYHQPINVNFKHDQPIRGNTVVNEAKDETPLQIPTPKKRKKKGKVKRRKPPKDLPYTQQAGSKFNSNQEPSWNNAREENVTFSPPPPSPPPPRPRKCNTQPKSDPESCSGRYIYVHTLPRRFNIDLLRDCKSLDLWMDMCQYIRNSGLGPDLPNSDNVFSEHGWSATNQFLLEVIFHNRMKQYDCLTTDSSKASAIFVPFYVGLDVARHLWNADSKVRDSGGFELVKLLKRKPEWKRWWGRDHFFVAGRITWDFRRSANSKDPDWGTMFLYLPESRNMTGLVIESSPWNNNDFGIPYPTYFHPANDDEVFQWQNRMRKQRRRNLFSFAGAPRPDRPDSIRNQLINQCEKSTKCMLIHCNDWKNKCHKPSELMKMFQSSNFCLQPPGDSYTRRSTFDSILAGCIPVFFHPGSAYIQYLWHLPREFTKYSVFISMYEVRDEKVSIQSILESIPPQKVEEMREEVIKLIPKITYADPRCRLETLEDAFDVAVKGVLERVDRIKEDMQDGRNDSFDYDEKQAWKYRWLGKLEEHEWDPYFSGSLDTRNFTNF